MKRYALLSLAIVLSALAFTPAVFAADKFASVSIERISEAYLKVKEYSKILEDRETAYTQEIDKKRNEVKQFQDKINLLNDKEKGAKSEELKSKIESLQNFVRQKQSDLRKEGTDKMMEVSKDIKDAIEKYAQKEGYTLVFDAMALAYQPKGIDISAQIIEILNKDYSGKKR
ncbi:MAG: OmpH family outer membrane protein [Candidatus Omnitrophota bacterium]|jgi:outer membrane protein